MKIMHISDLHFGYQKEGLIPFFLKEVTFFKPDVIIISGDLTHRATTPQYQALLRFLKKLPCKLCIVPGNHDISLHNILARLFYPFKKYNKYIGLKQPHYFTNETVRILGINSVNPLRVKDGRLSAHAMKDIKEFFTPSFSGLNMLFFHHNFDYFEGLHKPLENYQTFLEYLEKSPIHIVCTGHSHFANVCFVKKKNEQNCMILHAGTLLCARSKDQLNSYYLIDLQERECKVHWRVFTDNLFETQSTYEINFQNNTSLSPSLDNKKTKQNNRPTLLNKD